MKNRIFTTIFMLFMSVSAVVAQDFVVLKTGVEIKVQKVTDITPTEIKYIDINNPDGQPNGIAKSKVFMLRFANGKTTIVNAIGEEQASSTKSADTALETVAKKASVASSPPAVVQLPSVQNEPPTIVPTPKTRDNAPQVTQNTPQTAEQSTPSVSPKPQKQTAVQPPVVTKNSGFTVGLYVGGSLPMSSFAVQDLDADSKAAGAKLGLNGGIQVGYRFNQSLSVLLEGQFNFNQYAIQLADVRYIYTLRGDWKQIHALSSVCLEIPILPRKLSFYVQPSAGLAIVMVNGDFGDALKAANISTTSVGFGYGGTVGFVIAQHINLGFKYVGAHPAFQNYKPSTGLLAASIGYQF